MLEANYVIRDVVVRYDGGVLVMAEYRNENTESYQHTNYDPYYGYRTSTEYVDYYNFEDVMVLSLTPAGGLDWYNVIP